MTTLTNHSKPPEPMLASTNSPRVEDITFPKLASAKIDGVRCIIWEGIAYARSGKQIPNEFVQEWARKHQFYLQGTDGELVVGDPNDPKAFKNSSGALRRKGGEPDFKFMVFDNLNVTSRSFTSRMMYVPAKSPENIERVHIVPQVRVDNLRDLQELHQANVEAGFEGTIVRDPEAPYKHGRATTTSQAMFKMKPKGSDEAKVTGFVELYHNLNPAKLDQHGRTVRSMSKDGRVAGNTLGCLVVEGITGQFAGVEFEVGTGFNSDERKELWENRYDLVGYIISYEHMLHGADEKPRHPSFKGFRMREDMS